MQHACTQPNPTQHDAYIYLPRPSLLLDQNRESGMLSRARRPAAPAAPAPSTNFDLVHRFLFFFFRGHVDRWERKAKERERKKQLGFSFEGGVSFRWGWNGFEMSLGSLSRPRRVRQTGDGRPADRLADWTLICCHSAVVQNLNGISADAEKKQRHSAEASGWCQVRRALPAQHIKAQRSARSSLLRSSKHSQWRRRGVLLLDRSKET